MRLPRPRLASIPLVFLTAAYLLFGLNGTFWSKGAVYFEGHLAYLAALGLGVLLLMASVLTLFSMKYVIKPVLIFVVLVAAVAGHFVDTFGVVIDRDMIANAALTTSTETGHLITRSLVLDIGLFGVLPALLIAVTRIEHRPFWGKFRQNFVVVATSLVVTAGLVLAFYSGFASTFRAHRDLLASLNPAAPVNAAVKYALGEVKERDLVARPLGTDARTGARAAASTRPLVTVVVLGETARSMNFGLNGYARDTTPELAKRDVVSFTDVSSCGTSTAVSVPCMFSNLKRRNYSSGGARSSQNLTDVLRHAGVDVRWYDNDTGSIGVADRLDAYEFLPDTKDPRFCKAGECLDAILVDRLERALSDIKKDTVIVLHQLGSHGPAYHKRYPREFERFTPACRTAEFADCTREAIVASYDNTITYTDHVLAAVIDRLNARKDLASNMFYISDHGESLGENGIYLHAMPYFMAPSEQTQVPMIAWFSAGYRAATGLDTACLADRRDEPLSHDNFFHTILGASDVSSIVYDGTLDAYAPCRTKAPAPHFAAIPKAATR